MGQLTLQATDDIQARAASESKSKLNQPFVQQLTTQTDVFLVQNKLMGGEARNSSENSCWPALSQSENYGITLHSPSAPTRPKRMWKYDISPLGSLQSDMVVRVSFRHHQSGRMFTFKTNKNPTLRGRQRSWIILANWDRDSLLFQYWCYVYFAWPLSYPLTPSTPAQNTPWQTASLSVPSFPHYSCSLFPDTQTLRD